MAARRPKKRKPGEVYFDDKTGISMKTPIGLTKSPSLLKTDPRKKRSKVIVSEEFKRLFK